MFPAAAVEETEHHERQLDDKFQDKSKYGREQDHRQFKDGKVSPGLGDHVPEMCQLALHLIPIDSLWPGYYLLVAMLFMQLWSLCSPGALVAGSRN